MTPEPPEPPELTAISRMLACAIVQHASGYMETIPVTDWFDHEGDEVAHKDVMADPSLAVVAVAGPDEKGQWWTVDLSGFTVEQAPLN